MSYSGNSNPEDFVIVSSGYKLYKYLLRIGRRRLWLFLLHFDTKISTAEMAPEQYQHITFIWYILDWMAMRSVLTCRILVAFAKLTIVFLFMASVSSIKKCKNSRNIVKNAKSNKSNSKSKSLSGNSRDARFREFHLWCSDCFHQNSKKWKSVSFFPREFFKM